MPDQDARTYRIYFPDDQVPAWPADVQVEEVYPAFVMVTASEEAIETLRKRYPVEALLPPSLRPSVPNVAGLPAVVNAQRKRGPHTMVVRFRGPVRPEWIKAVEPSGCTYQQAISSTHAVVQCPSRPSLERLEQLPFVVTLTQYVPTIRLSPAFERLVQAKSHLDEVEEAAADQILPPRPDDEVDVLTGLLMADFFSTEKRDLAARRLRRQKIRIAEVGKTRLSVDLSEHPDPVEAIQAVTTRQGLRSLEERQLERTNNNVARMIVADKVATASPPGLGLTGENEIVAVADTGIDQNHPDFAGRIHFIFSYGVKASLRLWLRDPTDIDDGSEDLFNGHGTHVAGSILGNGARSAVLNLPLIEGVAPRAKLVFQAVEQATRWSLEGSLWWKDRGENPPRHGLFGIPEDLQQLLQDAYAKDARIHANSWSRKGLFAQGVYNEQSLAIDQFVWDHKDFLVLVAAGNAGRSKNGKYIELGSVLPPGTAKNCLTVGASENHRPDFSETYTDQQGLFLTDSMTDSIDDIAAFSGRGPCGSGRRKPDVVAPGTFVLSTRSSQLAGTMVGKAPFPEAPQDYMYESGTSMATPIVAGCAALVRQYLRTVGGIPSPSAALMKAVLIHSARYLLYPHRHPSSSRWADNEQGWGRVDLQQVLNPPDPVRVLFFDEQRALHTGQKHQFKVALAGPEAALRITMVYSDFPREQLVNNLNLFAYAPSGGYFIGNDFDNTGALDDANNVEGLVIEQPETGIWTVVVVATSVPEGPQNFALVVSGSGVHIP